MAIDLLKLEMIEELKLRKKSQLHVNGMQR